jgi:hypothetical protein
MAAETYSSYSHNTVNLLFLQLISNQLLPVIENHLLRVVYIASQIGPK